MADRTSQPSRKSKKRSKNKKTKHLNPVTFTTSNIRKDNNLINKYHALVKIQESVKKARGLTKQEREYKLKDLNSKIDKLGGINAYQKASKLGEKHSGGFNSAKWVVSKLKEHNIRGCGGKLKLLDVGALSCNYTKYKAWIDCTAIDLNPQNSSIIKADFLTLSCRIQYDVVVLSLVINFEGDCRRRGDMLRLCSKIVLKKGILFIVLPLPCVENSRFLNKELFISMTVSLGFTVVSEHCSSKLYFVMLKNNGESIMKEFPRKTLKSGNSYNNFAIIF
ncbi:25S rRNA (adenine(2142)-N(1))-methyltransferase-like [Exaiptasia diaphana]|uniref:S-adenosylmethionine sensor upstream of mTORC1 n=1 Tax=Exaiptasia diaphana TaxID=2652724 RepID=A0A913WTN0_EXADI|nr:25S rRNA (adenine(2142)-N(1))-methyltransferase-like [Exaiptasia diaphana]